MRASGATYAEIGAPLRLWTICCVPGGRSRHRGAVRRLRCDTGSHLAVLAVPRTAARGEPPDRHGRSFGSTWPVACDVGPCHGARSRQGTRFARRRRFHPLTAPALHGCGGRRDEGRPNRLTTPPAGRTKGCQGIAGLTQHHTSTQGSPFPWGFGSDMVHGVARERIMADRLTTEQRSIQMARVRSKDTAPELAVRQGLHRRGLRFRLHRRDLPGHPDLVFPRHRLAVFVHGCFWHGCPTCDRGLRRPKTNVNFWQTKAVENRARDARNLNELRALGWRVDVVWECETRERGRLNVALDRIASFVSDVECHDR